jgi:O-antigen ligase/polysaccharide polymerase Wzy-like membrane protein
MTLLEPVRAVDTLSTRASRLTPAAAVSVGAAILVGATASAYGSYFPTKWGWLCLSLGWLTAVALLVRRETAFNRLELAVLTALAAFVAWVALSAAWSEDLPQTILELERDLVYPLGLLTVLIFARPKSHFLLGGIAAGITAVCAYSLATRIFPGTFRAFDPTEQISGYRLQEPIGYWNALAIFAAMGALLALGFAMDSRSTVIRALAGASLVILVPTLYFTFSRGGWLALGIGLVAVLAVTKRRVRFVTLTLALALWPAIAVLVASYQDGLTTPAKLARAAHDGHRLAVVIAVLIPLAAATAAAIGKIEPRLRLSATLKRAWAAALILVVVGALVALMVREGSPPTLARKAWASFKGPGIEVKPGESLQRRLFSLSSSGRVEHFRVAWRDYAAHPVLGSGAGSYEQRWFKYRPAPAKVRDAHSLYIEVLAELGPVGLALLIVALGLPLVAAVQVRHEPLLMAAAGAYVAFLAHTGFDWDWEMVAVTLTAIGIAGCMLVATRAQRSALRLSWPSRAALLAAIIAAWGFAGVGLLGNFALVRSEEDFDAERWGPAAVDAHRAIRWQPWSGEGWKALGLIERGRGNLVAARRALAESTERDPGDWLKWIDLGDVSRGAEKRRAYAQAARLNPLGRETADHCRAGLVPRSLCRKPPQS